MDNREYPPLFDEGFKEIGLWELDKYFLDSFNEKEHRKLLIDKLQKYLDEFKKIGIDAELWIDGSFATRKPEPEDVDIVFLFDRGDIEQLQGIKQKIFEHLLQDRRQIKARYSCDVYYFDKNDDLDISKWIETFGYDKSQTNTKGIFKVILKSDV